MKWRSTLNLIQTEYFFPCWFLALSPFILLIELLSHDEIEVFFFTISVTCIGNKSETTDTEKTLQNANQNQWNVFFGSLATKCRGNLCEAVTRVTLNLPSYGGKFHTRNRKDVLKAFIHIYGAQKVFV